MIILGIDPGFGSLGYGVLSITKGMMHVRDFGNLVTPSGAPFPERLALVYDKVSELIAHNRPSAVVIEKLFFEKNTKTALDVSHARGVILLAAFRAHTPIVECTPLQVKLAATGNGRAEKRQVQHMMKILLGLPTPPKQDDAADALAIAYCGATML